MAGLVKLPPPPKRTPSSRKKGFSNSLTETNGYKPAIINEALFLRGV